MARREDYDIVLRATDQTQSAFASAQRGVAGLDSAVGLLKTGLSALGVTLAAGAIAERVKDAVSSLSDIGSAAKRVGVTTDAVQALRFEVQQGGGQISDADAALQKFADTASKAGTGSNYLAKIFQANNIAIKDQACNLRSASDLLNDYARLVANAASPQDKLRLSVEAFGRQAGPQMVQVLERIARESLQGVIDQAKALGVIIDKDIIAKADEIDKKWKLRSAQIETYIKGSIITALEELEKFPHEDSVLSHFMAMIKGTEKWSLTIDATPEPGSVLDWMWQKLRGGAVAVLGEPSTSFNDRFGSMAPPSVSPQASASIKEYLAVTQKIKDTFSAMGNGSTVLPMQNDALDKAINSLGKHVAAMEADARSVDATAGAHEALRVKMQLLEVAENAGINVSGEYAKRIDDIAGRASNAADMLAAMKLKSDIIFDRTQLGNTASEQAVAEKLRAAKIDASSATGQQIADELRFNDTLKETKSLADDALKGMVADWKANKSGAEVFADVLDKISTKLSNMAIDSALSALFKPASSTTGGFNLFSGIGKLFGFADGGSFQVGGSGGTDSQLVAFKASPNESVSVNKPGQGNGSSAQPIVYSPTYNFSGDMAPANKAWVAAMLAESERRTRGDVTSIVRGDLALDRNALGVTL